MGATQNRKAAETHPFPQIDQILLTAHQNGLKGDLREAEALYSDAERQSRALHYSDAEARVLTGPGGCQFGSFAYRKALRSFEEHAHNGLAHRGQVRRVSLLLGVATRGLCAFLAARDLARKLENPIPAGLISGSLASLYIDLGSLPEAAREIDRSIHLLSRAMEMPGPDARRHPVIIWPMLIWLFRFLTGSG